MADNTSIRCINFGDMISIVANRGQIAGEVQDRDLSFIKGSLNEHNITISTERNWHWRKFDRDYVFGLAISTGTVAVTTGSRVATFTGVTIDNTFLGKSFKVTGTGVLYRIIGINIAGNALYLSTSYVGQTNAAATYKIYGYEMPLPPDCDTITQIYFDFPLTGAGYGGGPRQLDPVNVLEFNRALSNNIDYRQFPAIYTRDGKISAETLPPLDVMVLDYDFLGGEVYAQVDRLRVFPIEPDIPRVLHLNYAVHVENMSKLTDTPLMPVDNRWVLVHFALSDWFRARGQVASADRELGIANGMLKEMRSEHKKTDPAPLFKNSLSRYSKRRIYNSKDELFWISRIAEN